LRKEYDMMDQNMLWNGRQIVVMLRIPSLDPRAGIGVVYESERRLENAVRDAEKSSTVPCRHDVRAEFGIPLDDGTTFYGWNVACPELLDLLLKQRAQGKIDFRAYYRELGASRVFRSEGNFFTTS
jgi:hypothetical protein